MAEPAGSPPIAFVAHSVPHRTRLRIPGWRHQPLQFAQLAERLLAHPQVRQVTVNAGTGSVLVRHDDVIGAIAADLGDIIRIVSEPAGSPGRAASRSLPLAPVSGLQVAAAGCLALGAWQLRRGRLLGTTSESLWHAYTAWRRFQMPGLAAALLGSGIVQAARGEILSPAVSLLFYAMSLRAAGRRESGSKPA